MFTVEVKTMSGQFIPSMGALIVFGEMHHSVEFGTEEQAARAAMVAHADMAPADLQVVNEEDGTRRTVADIIGRTVTRKEYNGARRLLRDNGRYSLRWMTSRVAAVMRQLQEAKPDDLAEKQAFFTGPHAAKVPAGYWTAAQRVKGWAGI